MQIALKYTRIATRAYSEGRLLLLEQRCPRNSQLMRNSKTILMACTILSLFQVTAAQNVSLIATSGYVLQSEGGHALYMPLRCDLDGNFYMREYESGFGASPVLRVSARAENSTKFSLDSVPELRGASIQDFSVTPDGTVYELLQFGDDVIIAEFSKDGRSVSQTKLEKRFWPAHLSALGGNTGFVVTGAELPQKGGPPPKLVNAIFDNSGRLVRRLTFAHDPAEIKEEKPGKEGTESQKGGPLANESVLPLVLGDTQTDNAGNFFILRATDPAVIFVVNRWGKLQRTIKVASPEAGMKVGAMQVRGGRLALLLQKSDQEGQIQKRTIVIIEASTGDQMAEYAVPDTLGTAFACYTGETFGFVTTTTGGRLAVQTAKPE
jgi:hypothetical protein